jgi:predicted nucleic acid-binding protein
MTEVPDLTSGSKVYVDSNMFIYLFEKKEGFAEHVVLRFSEVEKLGGRLLTSELTVAECCYKPAGDGNALLLSTYEEFFEQSGEVELVSLSGSVVKRAALVGASLGLKLLDAIHYVSALDAGCTHFLTGDKAFKSSAGLRVVQL